MTSTSTDRRDGVNSSAAIKVACRCATTANITLSGYQTIDGILPTSADTEANRRVLVKNQTTTTENGVYTMDTGTWARTKDFDSNRDVSTGTLVPVNFGTANNRSVWRLTTTGTVTFGTSAITFESAPPILGSSPFSVETIAELKALSGMAHEQVANLLGYYTAGDGGGGSFWWDSASSATDNGGTVLAADAGGVGRWKRIYSGALNVRWFGAKGDSSADDTAEIQSAVDASSDGGSIYFPSGEYLVSSSISLLGGTVARGLHLFGDGDAETAGYSGRSRIFGNFAGAIIDNGATTGSRNGGSIYKMILENTNAAGIGIKLSGFLGHSVAKCTVKAWRGILGVDATHNLGISDVRAYWASNTAGSIGIYASSHTTMRNVDVIGYETGINAFGTQVNIYGGRLEVNKTALVVGRDEINASNIALARSEISGLSFEANDVDVKTFLTSQVVFSGIGTQGSSNSPAGGSVTGLQLNGTMNRTVFMGVAIGGTYSGATFQTQASAGWSHVGAAFIGCDLGVDGAKISINASAQITNITFISTQPFGTAYPIHTPATITADQTAYAAADNDTFYSRALRLSSDAARTIHGLLAYPNTNQSATERVLINAGSQNITLANQSATETTAAYRIITGTGADIVLAPDDTAHLLYDRVTQRWRVLNTH